MIVDGELTQGDLEHMRQAAAKTVEDATKWAMEQPYPSAESVYDDIWA